MTLQLEATIEPVHERVATVDPAHALDGQWSREAVWWDGDEPAVTLKLVAWVVGIRCQKHPDGSWTMLGVMSRFDVLGKDEFVQPVERAVFLWNRWDSAGQARQATDYTEDVGIWYQPTTEQAMEVCRRFIAGFDFEAHCDPEAWEEEPANG